MSQFVTFPAGISIQDSRSLQFSQGYSPADHRLPSSDSKHVLLHIVRNSCSCATIGIQPDFLHNLGPKDLEKFTLGFCFDTCTVHGTLSSRGTTIRWEIGVYGHNRVACSKFWEWGEVWWRLRGDELTSIDARGA